MRTTLAIDDDLLAVAKCIADAKSISIGRVLSDLARRGLEVVPNGHAIADDGIPVFRVPAGSPPITLEDVKKLEDEW